MTDDEFDLALYRAAWRYAGARAEVLARKVVYAMQRSPASGIFGDRGHRTVWDEYCHECQYGPHEGLMSAWDHTLDGFLTSVANNVDELERELLELAISEPGNGPVELQRAMKAALQEIAGQRHLSGFEA